MSSICCFVCLVLSLPVSGLSHFMFSLGVWLLNVCVCTCVCERERERCRKDKCVLLTLCFAVVCVSMFSSLVRHSVVSVRLKLITGLSVSVLITCIYFPQEHTSPGISTAMLPPADIFTWVLPRCPCQLSSL